MTVYNHEKEHIFKHTPRYVMGHSFRGAKKALFLPGKNCFCIEIALQCGAINKNTELIIYEGHPDTNKRKGIVKSIEKKLKTMDLKKYEIREKNVLHDTLESDIQFAFLDFCGEMTIKVFDFLRRNNKLLGKIPTGYTFSLKPRSNKFYYNTIKQEENLERWFKIKYPTNSQFLSQHLECSKVSDWTLVKFFEAIQAFDKSWELNTLINYKESGQSIPMVFFSTNLEGKVKNYTPPQPKRRGRPPKVKKPSPTMQIAGKKAFASRLKNQGKAKTAQYRKLLKEIKEMESSFS